MDWRYFWVILMNILTQTHKILFQTIFFYVLDAEVYDYAFSPQKGEGFKLAIHSHMDQPIMALSDIDLSPGFVTQLSVTPILRETTEQARWRFNPEDRGCYFDGELDFKYLPNTLYRWDPIFDSTKKSRFDEKKVALANF